MDRSGLDHGHDTGQFRGIPPVEMGLVPLEVGQSRFGIVVPLESFQLADQLLPVVVVDDEVLRQSAGVATLRRRHVVGVAPVRVGRQDHLTGGLHLTDRQSERFAVGHEIKAAAPVDPPDLLHGIAAMEHLEGDSGVEAGLDLDGPLGQVLGTLEVDQRAELSGFNGQERVDQVMPMLEKVSAPVSTGYSEISVMQRWWS